MALPVPLIVVDCDVSERTEFTRAGNGFAQFVAEWPTEIPPDPPDVVDSGVPSDPYRLGDNAPVSHILYRVIENRAVPASDSLPSSVLTAIVTDTMQRVGWHQHESTAFHYRDHVRPVTGVERAAGKQVALMPLMGEAGWDIDSTTKCYWIVAWLGLDADSILVGGGEEFMPGPPAPPAPVDPTVTQDSSWSNLSGSEDTSLIGPTRDSAWADFLVTVTDSEWADFLSTTTNSAWSPFTHTTRNGAWSELIGTTVDGLWSEFAVTTIDSEWADFLSTTTDSPWADFLRSLGTS